MSAWVAYHDPMRRKRWKLTTSNYDNSTSSVTNPLPKSHLPVLHPMVVSLRINCSSSTHQFSQFSSLKAHILCFPMVMIMVRSKYFPNEDDSSECCFNCIFFSSKCKLLTSWLYQINSWIVSLHCLVVHISFLTMTRTAPSIDFNLRPASTSGDFTYFIVGLH